VVLADYVTTEDGTGLVHQAPAFGADDLATCRGYGLPVVNPIGPDGRFEEKIDLVGGEFFKTADDALVRDLERRGLLLRAVPYEHSYPHCWRCHTPLMYYAQLSWYIRTTKIRDALLRENERTTWYPEHIKHGRFGDWLENNVDWALSRNRYWGTPLPLWRCTEGHLTCVQSRAELGELAGRDLSDLDPHRPYIDEITFACPQCTATATRVPEVIDAWFDSGSMPFAQLGYPFAPGSQEEFAKAYPAQFICEAIDQTRGWFYTLMAVGTLAFDRSSYENVLCLGHIVAEDGRKMSKHLGNILEPISLMDRHGADALRWFMASSGSPWVSRRIGDATLDEIVRRVLLTYWNTVSFFTLYANASGWVPGVVAADGPSPLDRWLRAELQHVVASVDAALEEFDTAGAGRVLGQFVDDLSNWYVRLSRQRFWAGDPAALATLHETINVLTRLLAPFVPFLTEHVWQSAVRPGDAAAPESVHLATWPEPDEAARDEALRAQMGTVRALVEAGRAARKANNLRIRQPLARGLIGVPGELPPAELLAYVSDELNVRELASLHTAGEVVDVTVKPNFRQLGKRFGARTQQVAKAVAAADPAALALAVSDGGPATVEVDGEKIELTGDDLFVTQTPRTGWAVANQRDVLVALDTTITPELRRAGLAREVIRLIQDARKQADLAITDRITLVWAADEADDAGAETGAAVREHGREVAEAVLATTVTEADPGTQGTIVAEPELGLRFRIERATD
jgi:isoleucyl-tRNA synthetase